MKKLPLLITLFFLSGCMPSLITVPVGSILLAEDKATLIFYHEDGCSRGFCDVVLDGQIIGNVTPEQPLKINIEPGTHSLYIDNHIVNNIRRITTQTFDKGIVYYMKIWREPGMWVSSIWVNRTNKIDSYESKKYE